MVGDEKHALGACERGHKAKMSLYVDLQFALLDNEIEFEDGNFFWDMLGHLHKLPEDEQVQSWRKLGKVMLEIEKGIRKETCITLRKLSQSRQN